MLGGDQEEERKGGRRLARHRAKQEREIYLS
jgi:hypothetical protein